MGFRFLLCHDKPLFEAGDYLHMCEARTLVEATTALRRESYRCRCPHRSSCRYNGLILCTIGTMSFLIVGINNAADNMVVDIHGLVVL